MDDPVESGISKDLGQVPGTEVQPRVSLAPERQNRVGTKPHLEKTRTFLVRHQVGDTFLSRNLSVHPGREVDSEEGEPRVGHRVDVAVDLGRLLGTQQEVLAAEGNDSRLARASRHLKMKNVIHECQAN